MSIASLAPAWALGALGLHAVGDPHVADGFHYRLISDPRLGLPMRPIRVRFSNLGYKGRATQGLVPSPLRHEVTWTDSAGRAVVAPFQVTADNPVTGILPTNAISRCIWVDVETSLASDLRADAFRSTARGRRPLVARDRAPLSLAASDIDGVVVSGTGVVQGLSWLDGWRIPESDAIANMGLPRKEMERYLDEIHAFPLLQAAERVRRGAPARLGLHDDPTATGPLDAATTTPFAEVAKAGAQTPLIGDALDALLDELDAPQHALEQSEVLEAAGSTEQPTATWRPIDLLHQSLHDPTMARWLGFLDVDEFDGIGIDPGDVLVYMMESWWAIDPSVLNLGELFSFLPSILGYLFPGTTDEPVGGPAWNGSPDGLPIFRLLAPAALVVGHPPLGPAAPVVGPERAPSPPTPDGLGPWLPATPPEARRRATVAVSGLEPLATLAVATEHGGVVTGLNDRIDVPLGAHDDRALVRIPSVPANATDPASSAIDLRTVPAGGLALRVAQADVFGRWSPWGIHRIAAKERPPPPEPVFDLWYTMADVPADGGADAGALWGRLQARIQVPAPDSLAPGSHPLQRVRLTGDVGGVAVDVRAAPADPAAPELVVEIPRPDGSLLGVGRSERATITARWIDTGGARSAPSSPRVVTCVDPRASEVLPPRPVLDWTARPDATGRARVRLDWTPTGTQAGFRVFASDEQRLRNRAADEAGPAYQSFLDLLDAATDKPSRAQVLRDHHQLFLPDWFTNLTDEAIPTTGGELSFQHELSGSLGVLAVYKIVGETEAGVPADFTTSPLRVWAVPERSGPPQPLLEVLSIEPGPPVAARLRLRLTGDETAAVRYRLRRSVIHSDPRRMPVAQEGDIQLVDGEKYADLVDVGAFAHDAGHELEAGRPYTWRVEVQSADLPGSATPGAWSRPSSAVSTRLVPRPEQNGAVR